MGSKRRKFIKVDPVEAYATVGRLGIGDLVVLVCGDIEVTVTVNKLERSRQLSEVQS
ncbi:hypothetical protein SAMN04487914_108108 [Arthrobacter sp. ok909]|uniref:hypothetical protein n=1 Tax=Arthrobacter sp. ok909 TaxID=1761746 RepID=UPI00088CFE0D|nr:hypothetical protein [Arthrobacter sp. ok909]SDP33589.1 hypothetical protein SAMN04487914_108108 [Arthrobacter sp. ok909]